jgi:PBP1b-binding outer membrane lipoprotein LpoB
MKFALIVIGMVALAVLFAGCTSQEQKVDNVVSTSAPVYENKTDVNVTMTPDNNLGLGGASLQYSDTVSATQTPMYYNNEVVSLGGNASYQLTGAEVQGCKIAAYIDNNGTTEMRNAPDNPVGCPTNAIGRV